MVGAPALCPPASCPPASCPPAFFRARLRRISLFVLALLLASLWLLYIAVLIDNPSLLNTRDPFFLPNVGYAISAVATTIVAFCDIHHFLKHADGPALSTPPPKLPGEGVC